MKLTTRGSLAAVVACVASAATGAPAVAAGSVPVTVPLESVEAALPVEAPSLSTGVPVPVPGAPETPRHTTGNLLPDHTLPAVPFAGQLPETLVELPVDNPLGEGELGVVRAVTEASDLRLSRRVGPVDEVVELLVAPLAVVGGGVGVVERLEEV
ncbi:hypothetical protein AB0E16_17120, partial [Streptomyces sp. NPDC047970]|uniref:hypothetical protein n=1 Tax=Streptomyces sp. NPDC047970 TaxID=3155481 RepID=UPI0034134E20